MSERKGYRQFCPVAKAAEVVAERWTFLVIRELLAGSNRFNDLRRGLPMMSPSLLSQRLKELERAGVIERHAAKGQKGYEYSLTEAGADLRPIVESLGVWGIRWAQAKIDKDDLDPGLLMWDIRRNVRADLLPTERTVIEFDFGPREKKRLWWLVVENAEADLCLTFPGYDIDATVAGTLRALTEVWLGRMPVREALNREKIKLEGPDSVTRTFQEWFGLSPMAYTGERARM